MEGHSNDILVNGRPSGKAILLTCLSTRGLRETSERRGPLGPKKVVVTPVLSLGTPSGRLPGTQESRRDACLVNGNAFGEVPWGPKKVIVMTFAGEVFGEALTRGGHESHRANFLATGEALREASRGAKKVIMMTFLSSRSPSRGPLGPNDAIVMTFLSSFGEDPWGPKNVIVMPFLSSGIIGEAFG